jgi:hypothetical protein
MRDGTYMAQDRAQWQVPTNISEDIIKMYPKLG